MRTLPVLPPRRPDGHKGDYGRVLVLAGSTGMVGAAALAGEAALRAGAGLATVATPKSVYPILAAKLTCCTTHPLPETRAGTLSDRGLRRIFSLAKDFDVVALGPGLGRHGETTRLVHALTRDLPLPMVIDADGLNALAENPAVLAKAKGSRILTPHPGEMARLLGCPTEAVQGERKKAAVGFAEACGAVVLLKGHRTVVTDGECVHINTTGNPGMATGGTGDVLTGVVAGLLAQGLTPFDAARLAAHVHGLAGDIAAKAGGEVSLIATDLLDALPLAFLTVRRKRKKGR